MEIKIIHIDTACCLIKIDGCTILTDPVFDNPGKYYHHGFGAISKKIDEPSIELDKIPKVDLILLSHPQNKDNFDNSGLNFAKNVPIIISTKQIEKKYKNGIGLKTWDEHVIKLPNGELTNTATPASHHPWWLPEFFSGKVIGFVLEHSNSKESIYITGDTVYFNGIEKTAKRFQYIFIGLIHVGNAQFDRFWTIYYEQKRFYENSKNDKP